MKWIKIEDKVPIEGQKTWTYFVHTGISVMTYHSLEGTKDEIFGKHLFIGGGGFLTDDVTHWMPYTKGNKKPKSPNT